MIEKIAWACLVVGAVWEFVPGLVKARSALGKQEKAEPEIEQPRE